jgi:tetratricopeptide (TPR) repeat protein
LKIALTIDPLSPETLFFSAYFDYMNEDYAGALKKLNRCLAQNPGNIPAHTVKCYCLLKLGHYEEVLDYLDLLPAESVAPGDRLGLTTVAHTLKNDGNQAAKYLEDLAGHAATAEGFRAVLTCCLCTPLQEKEKKPSNGSARPSKANPPYCLFISQIRWWSH